MSQRQSEHHHRHGSNGEHRWSNDEHASRSSERVLSEEDMNCWKQYANTPDQSKGDFYCKVCACRVPTAEVWNCHVAGKKHVNNIRKGPCGSSPKEKNIPCEEPSVLEEQLNKIEAPVVGLNFIRETKQFDCAAVAFYNCFLCKASLTTSSVMDHIISAKHRLAYIEREDPEYAEQIKTFSSKFFQQSLIETHAAELEVIHGRGQIEVYMESQKRSLAQVIAFYKLPISFNPRQNVMNRQRRHVATEPSTSRTSCELLPTASVSTRRNEINSDSSSEQRAEHVKMTQDEMKKKRYMSSSYEEVSTVIFADFPRYNIC